LLLTCSRNVSIGAVVTFFLIEYASLTGPIIYASLIFKSASAFQNPLVTCGAVDALNSQEIFFLPFVNTRSISAPADVRKKAACWSVELRKKGFEVLEATD
jgi:hypothetical protein